MNQHRKISIFSHIRNLKDLLIAIPLGLIFSSFLYLIEFDEIVFVIFGIILLLSLIPIVLIHVNYFKTDKHKTLTIDLINQSIELNENYTSIKIIQTNIQTITMTTGLDRAGASVWSGYFFYQIELINGDIIYLTSLLLKKKDLLFHVDFKRHIAFPFVKYFDLKAEKSKEVKIVEEATENQINSYYEKYSKYSFNDLKMIADNKEKYQIAAVRAAERLINEKITVANK